MGYFLSVLYNFLLVSTAGAVLHVVFSLAGRMFFAFPVIYTVSRYTLAISEEVGYSPWIAFLFGAIVAFLVGLIFALLERRLSKDAFTVLSVAAVFASLALARSWTSVTNGVLGIAGVDRPAGFESLGGVVLIAGVISAFALSLNWLFLHTRLSRQWRALKEAPIVLEGLAISSKRLSFWTLALGALFLSFTAMPYIWFTQYVDPTTGGILSLLEGLSIAILVQKPKTSHVLFASVFVSTFPELLRLLDLPSNVVGPLRSILYSVFLAGILLFLQKRRLFTNRSI